MNAKQLTLVLGWAFLVIGILGFIPGLTTDAGLLFGIFEVDAVHNIVHLLAGIAGLWMASRAPAAYLKFFGLAYLAVTVVGFLQKDTVLGIMKVNTADNWLHLLTSALALIVGFKKE
jgi:hypothetical protein